MSGKPRVLLLGLLLVVCLLTLGAGTASASSIVLQVGQPTMTVDGVAQEIDPGQGTAPVIVSDRTFVPIRAIVTTMGGTVGWAEVEQKVTIGLQGTTIELWIGKCDAKVNGQVMTLDSAPFVSSTGRTMLPLAFVIKNLGAQVAWDGENQRITVTYGAANGAPVADFSGTWILNGDNQKLLTLTQNGSQVSGTMANSWMVSGTVTGNQFEGQYYQDKEGIRISLTMGADGKSFTGLEYYSDSPDELNGTKQ